MPSRQRRSKYFGLAIGPAIIFIGALIMWGVLSKCNEKSDHARSRCKLFTGIFIPVAGLFLLACSLMIFFAVAETMECLCWAPRDPDSSVTSKP